MSLANYTGLLASVADFLSKSNLTAVIPDFVTMAEAEMNRRLDVRQMESQSDFSIAGETAPIPADFRGVKSFRVQNTPRTKLAYISPDQMDDVFDGAVTDSTPYYYTIVGETFLFSPNVTTGDVRLRYRASIPPLASNATNWLLTAHPDAYLYGSLMHSAPYLRDDPRLPLWQSAFAQIIADINADGQKQALGSTLQPLANVTV